MSLDFISRFTKDFTDISVSRTLFVTFVSPIVEYGSVIRSPSYHCHISRLEKCLKKFVRICAFRSGIDMSYKELHKA
ncbi:hypothetical protein J437_LFUL017000 [Ladona fulva]|uniref:Uncharacterized protein n=1 Tax=Ladona fulva TaxID=123851 RepID=A0A8K0KN94_LADFU|nr:hypothetical protein J437_LFUL017000 [Ladona fulva]